MLCLEIESDFHFAFYTNFVEAVIRVHREFGPESTSRHEKYYYLDKIDAAFENPAAARPILARTVRMGPRFPEHLDTLAGCTMLVLRERMLVAAIDADDDAERIDFAIKNDIAEIKANVTTLVERQTIKAFYTTEEFARIVNRRPFTVREYCRSGRLKASKQESGRGAHPTWVISHEELQRYQREGRLPIRRFA